MNQALESRRLPIAAFAAALIASFVYLVANGTNFAPLYDEWELLVRRPGWAPDAILEPFHEHLIAAPALIYKTLQATFGMTSQTPAYVVSILLLALAAGLAFVYLRSRVGGWPAFFATLPVLFLGAASEDLLWAFQMCFYGSVAAGVGMLLALERGDRAGDRLAALLCVVSVAFSGVGVPFLLVAVLDVALGPRPRRRRLFVAAIPLGLYALWWLGWGHNATHHLSLENLVHLPAYLFDAAGAAFAALFGQEVNDPSNPGHAPLPFRLLAVAVGIAIAVKVARERRISRQLVLVLTVVLAFWVLAGLDREMARPPISNRFQLPAAVFVLLVLGEALRGVRVPRLAVFALAAIAAVATVSGIGLLNRERGAWEVGGFETRAALAGVELAGDAGRPDHLINDARIDATVERYRDAAGRFGTPAYDEAEILVDPEGVGTTVDRSLAAAIGVRLARPTPGALAGDARCRGLDGARDEGIAVHSENLSLANRGPLRVEVEVGRFAPTPTVSAGVLPAGATRTLRLPPGASRQPWAVGIADGGPIKICEQPPGP